MRYLAIAILATGTIFITTTGLCAPRSDSTPEADSATHADCGAYSLCVLLKLEGRQVALADILTRLPPPGPRGHSMKELQEAAGQLGIRLLGVRLDKNLAFDKPMMVLFGYPGHGHFVVMSPVGHTGKLTQIYDMNQDPVVIDVKDVYAGADWTGLALVPQRTNYHKSGAVCLLGLMGFLSYALVFRRRPPRDNEGSLFPPITESAG